MEAHSRQANNTHDSSPSATEFGIIHTHNHSHSRATNVVERNTAHIALYESPYAAPRIITIGYSDPASYIESISTTVHSFCREFNSPIPYTVIKELSENFIHSHFCEPIVSICDRGCTLRFSDQGPGIQNKQAVTQPGFTSATWEHKKTIRGVGSGLPMVIDYLHQIGGHLTIEDNVSGGAVVTIRLKGSLNPLTSIQPEDKRFVQATSAPLRDVFEDPRVPAYNLSERQREVLAIVVNNDPAGPSLIADYLGIGLSTAYRDLQTLQNYGLVRLLPGGKRSVTDSGLTYIDIHM